MNIKINSTFVENNIVASLDKQNLYIPLGILHAA